MRLGRPVIILSCSLADPLWFVSSRPPNPLDGQLELLALHDLGVVDPEEVAVHDSLNDAGHDGDPVHLMVLLGNVTIDPVGDVQCSVNTQSC